MMNVRTDMAVGKGGPRPNESRAYTGRIVQILVFAALGAMVLSVSGCAVGKVGGYEHVDLSKSRYKVIISEMANKLSQSEKAEHLRAAAKYYGSIAMLDEMDLCVAKYAKKEPEMGLSLVIVAEQINEFYSRKPK
jgi:hypothetical protein